jgi:hypothetical protein
MTELESHESIKTARDTNKFRFERSFNLGSIVTILGGLITAFAAYRGISTQLDHIERAALKSDVMWEHFVREHQDISYEDLKQVR